MSNSAYTTAANPVSQQLNPTYMSQLFPNGLPQVSAQGVTGANAAGTTAQGTYAQGGQNINAGQYGAGTMTNEIMSALAPQFAQQQRGLTDNLANAGIVGGSTTGAVGDLSNQQTTQAMGLLAPIQQAANAQQLGAQEYNSTQQQANNQFNASQGQANNQYNASQAQANNQYNASNDMTAQQYNAGAANTASNTNVANSLSAGQLDAGTYNTLLQQILGYQNQGYLQNQQDQYGLDTGAASGQQASFTPIYQQAGPGILGAAASAAGTYFGSGGGKAAAAAA